MIIWRHIKQCKMFVELHYQFGVECGVGLRPKKKEKQKKCQEASNANPNIVKMICKNARAISTIYLENISSTHMIRIYHPVLRPYPKFRFLFFFSFWRIVL